MGSFPHKSVYGQIFAAKCEFAVVTVPRRRPLGTMIRHAIDVVSHPVRFLNPGQVPILACDQPLYVIIKKIQWNWPSTYGEKELVVMFESHTKLAALKAIGNWLKGSGWTNALVQAELTTPGTADSFLKAARVVHSSRPSGDGCCSRHPDTRGI